MLDRLKTILSSSLSDPKAGDPVIEIEGQTFPIRIHRSAKARRISLRADAIRREIRVTMPSYAPTQLALNFVAQKRQWIAARMESSAAPTPLRPGGSIGFIGETHRISWKEGASRSVRRHMDDDLPTLTVGGPEELVGGRVLRWLKSEARRFIAQDIKEYCDRAGENCPRLKLGDPRSRWGSCSSHGTISLSWRLIMAPEHVRRSVVAHEVAHLRHMNHSADFYDWLDQIYEGDRRIADQWLKMHGTALQLVGR